MKNSSKILSSLKIAAVASFALLVTGIRALDASAAEISFLCAEALESSMRELIPAFETTTGHSVKMMLANAGTTAERVRRGEVADLAIVRLTADRPYEIVVKGGAEIGFSIAEIVASPEVDLVGPLPGKIQNFIIFTTAIPINAEQVAAAKALIECLTSPGAKDIFKSKGIDPG